MKTANANFENHHVNALFSFHTEKLLYQKSDFRAIGEAKRNPKVVFILRSLMTAFASCSVIAALAPCHCRTCHPVIARLDRAIPPYNCYH